MLRLCGAAALMFLGLGCREQKKVPLPVDCFDKVQFTLAARTSIFGTTELREPCGESIEEMECCYIEEWSCCDDALGGSICVDFNWRGYDN